MGLIKKHLPEFGLLSEMKDWKQHFINGTKGMKKITPEEMHVLTYVEGLLKKTFDGDEDKVNNNALAPWLVTIVRNAGNINGDKLNKIKTVLDYFKRTGNPGNIPKMELDQAAVFAKEKIDKMIEKEKAKQNAPAQDNKDDQQLFDVPKDNQPEKLPTRQIENFPLLADEISGKIQRIWTPGDGSGRMWVKVIDQKWLAQLCGRGRTWAMGGDCQLNTFSPRMGYQNYQFIGPPKGNPTGPYTTIVAFAVNTKTKGLGEVKQENNNLPGVQATSGGWKDAAAQVVDFLCNCPEIKTAVDKMGDYYGNHAGEGDRYSGGMGFLRNILKEHTELFNKLAECRPDIIENSMDGIAQLLPKDWTVKPIDINELAQNNPLDFLKKLNSLIEKFGKQAIDLLQKINIEYIAKEHPGVILDILGLLIGNIPASRFMNLIKGLNFQQFITVRTENFKSLFKGMSNVPEFKNLFKEILTSYPQEIIAAFGGKLSGVFNFLNFADMPRLPKHNNAVKNLKTNQWVGIRKKVVNPEGGHENRVEIDEEFIIPDNLKIMSQKERRDFVIQNKELIKSFVNVYDENKKPDELGKEISYLRVLFSESNPQDVERIFSKEKEQFINYYQKKFESGKQKKVSIPDGRGGANVIEVPYTPGIIEYYKAVNKGKPNAILTEVEESSLTSKFSNDNDVKKINYYPIGIDEAKKNIESILKYYYILHKSWDRKLSTSTNDSIANSTTMLKQKELENIDKEIKFRYKAVRDFVKTLEVSGMGSKEASEYYLKMFNPKNLGYDPSNQSAMYNYILYLKTFLDEDEAKKKLVELKPLIVNSDKNGIYIYNKLVNDYSSLKYAVKVGDMVMYLGYKGFTKLDDALIKTARTHDDIETGDGFLTHGKLYKVIETKEFNKIENGVILVMDDGNNAEGNKIPKERWFLSCVFKINMVKVSIDGQESIVNQKILTETDLKNTIRNKLKMLIEDKKKRVSYTGVILDNRSKYKLYDFIKEMTKMGKLNIPDDWTFSADHLTINMGQAIDKSSIGQSVSLKVLTYSYDNNVFAVGVKANIDLEFEKEYPHITIAFNEKSGARPVMSNKLTLWKPVPKSFMLNGTIQEVMEDI